MGGASRQETFKPTDTINLDAPLLNAESPDSIFIVIGEDDTLLKNTPVHVFPIEDNKYSTNGFPHRKVKLGDGREGYIREDFLTPIPSQTPAPDPEQSKILGEPGKIKHFGETY